MALHGALDRGIGGPLDVPSSYFMKSPPVQYTDDEAHRLVEAFISGSELVPATASQDDGELVAAD